MKKLSLEIAKASLSRDEMRMITGGSREGNCSHNVCGALSCCSHLDECYQGKCRLR